MDTAYAIKLFGALFAIMNPISNLPVFLSVTNGAPVPQQRYVALKVALYTAVLGSVVAVTGTPVLKLFGISINDLRVAGGLVVLLIALNMLRGEHSESHRGSDEEQADYPDSDTVAFFPLTFPIIMGPGTITTLIIFHGQAQNFSDHISFWAVFALMVLMLAAVFSFGSTLSGYLSTTARVIMSRLMGMILAAIAVGMMATGLKELLPGLA